jgi:hypothetical protein
MSTLPVHSSTDGCRMGALMVVLFAITSAVSTWSAISFILYLFKEHPFAWLSLGLTIAGFVAIIYLFIWMLANDKY